MPSARIPARLRRSGAAVLVVLALAVAVVGCGGDASASSVLTSIGAGLQGPAGLTATSYATGLANVAALATDADGRLWAATATYEDDGTDGVYLIAKAGATPVRVIRALHTPLGLLWYDGTLYVSSHAKVTAYSGFDGSTFAASQVVVTLPDSVGENNGLAVSPAGRISLGISAPCDACTSPSEYSASVVSFRPDGSDLRVDVANVRAPVGLAYYPGTDDLFVTMNQQDSLEDTPGDVLTVVHRGEDWNFPTCTGLGGLACSGVPEPTATLDAHAAVSGVAILTGPFGSTAGPAAFVAEWATGKVQRVALTKTGSTYTSAVEPFLTGLEQPVPVLAQAGALYVGDWGTGTIYRITTTATP